MEKNWVVGELARRVDGPAATVGIQFLDNNYTSLAHDKTSSCERNPSRADDVLDLGTPKSNGFLEEKENNTSAKKIRALNYLAMETMTTNMTLSPRSHVRTVYKPAAFWISTYFFSEATSSFSLIMFKDVAFHGRFNNVYE